MARLSPPGHQRLRQALPGMLEATFAGAEANISASIAMLGGRSRYVTALPKNLLGEACLQFLRGIGVDTSCIIEASTGRMPAYFVESGAAQRPSTVLYDRDYSSFSLTPGSSYNWDAIFADASWLMISGISPALSATAADVTLTAAREARNRGIAVCCDLNFRATLWNWKPGTSARDLAQSVMGNLMPFIDVVITNPEQAADVLAIPWAGSEERDEKAYTQAARRIALAYPHLQKVIFTMRENISASHNNIGALLYEPASHCVTMAPCTDGGQYSPYSVHPIVDRIGAGDAFAAGLIYAFTTPGFDTAASALSFAIAASCLAHSIPGDINFANRAEIEFLVNGNRSGRILR